MENLPARALLARVPGLNAVQLSALVEAAGGELARALEPRTVRAVDLPQPARSYLLAPDEAALGADLAWLAASGGRILLCTDAEYPPLLRQFAAAPAVLYVLGSAAALAAAQLAIVGSRSPTPEGHRTARAFAAWFARAGVTVTGELAAGIGASGLEGALEAGGTTVAVCAAGLDRCGAGEQAALARRIAAHGVLLSQVPPGTVAARAHARAAGRLIALLTVGMLVVEASRHSEPLASARLAAEAGREVFAIPGSIHSPLAHGCHQLIKEGAKLVEDAADVLAELKISFSKEQLTSAQSAPPALPALDKEYEMLLDALGFEPATADTLATRTRLPGASVASMLLILELAGRVAALPGGHYGRIP